MSLQLAAASYIYIYIYIYYALKKKRKKRRCWQRQLLHKQRSVEPFKFAGRPNFQSVTGLYKNVTQ